MQAKKETEEALKVEELKEKERLEREEAASLRDELREVMDKQKAQEEEAKVKE